MFSGGRNYLNKDNKQNSENKTGIIIGLGAALVVGAIVLCIALVSVLGESSLSKEDATRYVLTSGINQSLTETNNNQMNNLLGDTNSNETSGNEGANGQVNEGSVNENQDNKTPVSTTENDAVAYYEHLSKNGDNKLSDHYENEFIKLVSTGYNVDSDLLVAIYSEPDTGNNFVLQFNGTRDSGGNIVKSPDTLEKVYQIDIDRNVKVATGTQSGNVGVSYAEGIFCFNMVKTLVMEQYPDYFTGLKD